MLRPSNNHHLNTQSAWLKSFLSNSQWVSNFPTPFTLRYSFTTNFFSDAHVINDSILGNQPPSPLWHLKEPAVRAVRESFQTWSSIANIQFIEDDTHPDVHFYAHTKYGHTGRTIFTSSPGRKPALMGLEVNSEDTPYLYERINRQIGLILGLQNPQNSPMALLLSENQLAARSVMNPEDHARGWRTTWTKPIINMTPMPADYTAVQFLYGENMATRSGDDIYDLNTTLSMTPLGIGGRSSYFRAATLPWDAGGTNTLNASSLNCTIALDMNPNRESFVEDIFFYTPPNVKFHHFISTQDFNLITLNSENNVIDVTRSRYTMINIVSAKLGKDIVIGFKPNDAISIRSIEPSSQYVCTNATKGYFNFLDETYIYSQGTRISFDADNHVTLPDIAPEVVCKKILMLNPADRVAQPAGPEITSSHETVTPSLLLNTTMSSFIIGGCITVLTELGDRVAKQSTVPEDLKKLLAPALQCGIALYLDRPYGLVMAIGLLHSICPKDVASIACSGLIAAHMQPTGTHLSDISNIAISGLGMLGSFAGSKFGLWAIKKATAPATNEPVNHHAALPR